jgi:hypothetical protein
MVTKEMRHLGALWLLEWLAAKRAKLDIHMNPFLLMNHFVLILDVSV